MADIQIPPEAEEAVKRAVALELYKLEFDARVSELTEDEIKGIARAAAEALLKAWPGMWHVERDDDECLHGRIILPLPADLTPSAAHLDDGA